MMKIDDRTRPCPFCGEMPFLLSVRTDEEKPKMGWMVRCMRCGCNQMPFDSDESAIERWNRRACQ